MDHYFWTSSLVPYEGWTVERWVKRGNLFSVRQECYERLTMRERDAVLEAELDWLLQQLATG